jgi:hypothetical protein
VTGKSVSRCFHSYLGKISHMNWPFSERTDSLFRCTTWAAKRNIPKRVLRSHDESAREPRVKKIVVSNLRLRQAPRESMRQIPSALRL